jgi:hypothetical protein
MPIHHHRGGTTITGESLDYSQICVWRGAVKLEAAGIKMSRGPKLMPILAKKFGIKKTEVLAHLETEIARLRPLQEHTGE